MAVTNGCPTTPWWRDWLKPQVLLAVLGLAGALTIGWVKYGLHCANADVHHSLRELDGQYISAPVHQEQQRAIEQQLGAINDRLKRIEERLDRGR